MTSIHAMLDRSIIKDSSFYRWGERRAFAAKLLGSSGPQPLQLAIKNTSSNVLSKDEKAAVAAIEDIRRSLEHDDSVIEIRDYGAGTSDEPSSGKGSPGDVIKHRGIGEICRSASKNQLWCLFLFHLIRQFKPQRCIEMGTCLGISASFISSALKFNGSGQLVTLEGSPPQAEIARSTFGRLGLENVTVRVGKFEDTLREALGDMEPVSFVFIDGHHEEAATCHYFDIVREYLDVENIVVFDDIRWSEGMKSAWRTARTGLQSYDLGPMGLCVNVGRATREASSLDPGRSNHG